MTKTLHFRRFWLIAIACLVLFSGLALADDTGYALITGGHLHLRETPSTDGKIIATYQTGTRVTILSVNGDWAHVEVYDGMQGYMLTKFLKAASLGVVENEGKYVNLRIAPSTNTKVLAHIASGTLVHVNYLEGNWTYITADGQSGYMLSHFIKPAPADSSYTPSADTATSENPYHFSTAGENSLTQQVGTMSSLTSYEGHLMYTLYYPIFDIPAIDMTVAGWLSEIIRNGEAYANEDDEASAIEILAQYDSYLIGSRYMGLLESGFYDGALFAHPYEIVYTLNYDLATGQLLSASDIFGTDDMDGVLAILRTKLSLIEGDLVNTLGLTVDASWLDNIALTGDGVAVLLERGAYLPSAYGAQCILLPYGQLQQANLLALELGSTAPTATPTQAPAITAPPQADSAIDPTRPMIALTFDDGPGEYTETLLNLLAANNAKATFCMVGNRVANYQDVVKRVAAEGHGIATHTWSHKNLTTLSNDAIAAQFDKSIKAITALTGQPIRILRPPYGAVNQQVRSVAKKAGLVIVNWSIDTEDWKTHSADATYNEIMKKVENGSIILCHDIQPSTAKAMERVIPELVARGYQLVTLSELLAYAEGGGIPGNVYRHVTPTSTAK